VPGLRSIKGKRVTLADVAAHAGVDTSVVSRIVNDDPVLNVRPETRERVKAALKELGYRPNAAARSLRTSQTGTLGLFLPDFANPVYAEIITGAEVAAAEQGFVLVTGSSTVSGSSRRAYLDLLGQGRVDGLLLSGEAFTTDIRKELQEFDLPYLLINRRVRGLNRYIILDDERAARLAVDHLIGLGHTAIAHIAGPANADTARRRRAGYEQAMKAAGLGAKDISVIAADYTPEGGVRAMEQVLSSKRRPTAVVVANIASAIGALHAALAMGLKVPEELSIVAIHDSPLAAFLTPPLTTVRMPLHDLGYQAVQLLLESSRTKPLEHVVEGPTELIVRSSTGPVPSTTARRGR